MVALIAVIGLAIGLAGLDGGVVSGAVAASAAPADMVTAPAPGERAEHDHGAPVRPGEFREPAGRIQASCHR